MTVAAPVMSTVNRASNTQSLIIDIRRAATYPEAVSNIGVPGSWPDLNRRNDLRSPTHDLGDMRINVEWQSTFQRACRATCRCCWDRGKLVGVLGSLDSNLGWEAV